jgi:hypothetical protein
MKRRDKDRGTIDGMRGKIRWKDRKRWKGSKEQILT